MIDHTNEKEMNGRCDYCYEWFPDSKIIKVGTHRKICKYCKMHLDDEAYYLSHGGD